MDAEIIRMIERYISQLERDPRQKVYAPLADSYRRASLLSDAEDTCHKGLNMFPGYLRCREVLGKIYIRKSLLEEARKELEKVAQVITDSHDLNRTLGRLYYKLNEFDLAQQLLQKIVEKDPFDFEAKNILTEIQRKISGEEEEIYEYRPKKQITDIRAIIAQTYEPSIKDKKAYEKATDEMLGKLEDVEEILDSKADDMLSEAESLELNEEFHPVDRPKNKHVYYNEEESHQQINAAAQLAQIEMELSLVDEALLTTKKLLEKEPENESLAGLAKKLESRVEEIEEELERLESISPV